MWPYNHEEDVWLNPAKDWAKGRLQRTTLPKPANDDNGAWPCITTDDREGTVDPQIFIGK